VKFSVKDVKQLGKAAQLARKTQGLDQMSVASLSSNGTTFLSEFENGKPTVELGRVLRVLDSLGIDFGVILATFPAMEAPKWRHGDCFSAENPDLNSGPDFQEI